MRYVWSLLTYKETREAIKVILSLFGGIATAFAGASLIITVWDSVQDRKLAEERLVTERFSKAVELLSSSSENVQVGSIFTLGKIAQDSPNDRWTIISLLLGYVPEIVENSAPSSDVEQPEESRKVIQAVLSVLAVTNTSSESNETPAICKRVDLSRRMMQNADLREARFGKEGSCMAVNLEGADLRGANLQGANLEGANLLLADLRQADLSGANLKDAYIAGLKLDNQTNFSNADLTGVIVKGPRPGITVDIYEAKLCKTTLGPNKRSERDCPDNE